MLQLANQSIEHYCYYIHWVVSPQYSKASISARNKPGAYIKIFTGALISYNAQNHPMDVVTVAFICSENVRMVSKL